MPATPTIVFPDEVGPINEQVRPLLSGCAHYTRSDMPLFLAAYNELCREDLSGKKVLEICCGAGDLALEVARAFPKAEVIAMDRNPDGGGAIRQARETQGLLNARYDRGNSLQLEGIADNSLDLVYGQATLHHLAHDPDAVGKEMSRVLKPGGRLVFIYEPFGHNPVWAAIRAYRTALNQWGDESNVVLPQLEQVAQSFSTCDVQVFNFVMGYPAKVLGRLAGESFSNYAYRLDTAIMKRWPSLARMAANFNAIFTK